MQSEKDSAKAQFSISILDSLYCLRFQLFHHFVCEHMFGKAQRWIALQQKPGLFHQERALLIKHQNSQNGKWSEKQSWNMNNHFDSCQFPTIRIWDDWYQKCELCSSNIQLCTHFFHRAPPWSDCKCRNNFSWNEPCLDSNSRRNRTDTDNCRHRDLSLGPLRIFWKKIVLSINIWLTNWNTQNCVLNKTRLVGSNVVHWHKFYKNKLNTWLSKYTELSWIWYKSKLKT